MTQAIQKKLNDSAWARWTALILVALTMFFGYMFVDVLSPLQNMLESTRGWSPTIFGLYGGSEFILNVCGFLLVAGIILDKMGVRFTGVMACGLMVGGALLKAYAVSPLFPEGGMLFGFKTRCGWPDWVSPSSAWGAEICGITPDDITLRWKMLA